MSEPNPASSQRPTEPRRPSLALAWAGVIISCLYLANIGAGFLGEIPDVLPGIGNLDEAFFTALLLSSLAKLGIDILPGRPDRAPTRRDQLENDL